MIEKTTRKLAFVSLTIFATGGGTMPAATVAVESPSVIENSATREIDSPAGPGSGDPNLSVGPDGRVYLSWLEPVRPKGYALKFAVRARGGRWSTPRTITRSDTRFDSSILALPDGSLSAYWLSKSGPGMHANDVNLSISRDGGQTWGKPIVPHRDRTQTGRGFVSMISVGGGIAVVWLDGRKMTGGDRGAAEHGPADSKMEMSLMYTTIGPDGKLGKEVLLDGRICECCQTSAARPSARRSLWATETRSGAWTSSPILLGTPS